VTASSAARSRIACTFARTLSGGSIFESTDGFALLRVHLGGPPPGLGRGASKRSRSSGMLAGVLRMVYETYARRRIFDRFEDAFRCPQTNV